ncbi:MAG TPA: folylpolyglutamate synthase/dihydrofolate synthase family protein [Phycisphaerae bacterium]|nr:folylpolyglutamate synthase/dihydrofolate synthase family protein [Phycisphaerae bacterium]
MVAIASRKTNKGTKKKTTTRAEKAVKTAASGVKFRNYPQALKYLFSLTDYEQMLRVRYNRDTFSLDRMEKLLKKIGNPHKKIKSVHIAGTKGKGSTSMMLASMLQHCGYKVGLYTSPHICDVRERISINGECIAKPELSALIAKISSHVEQMKKDRPTFFEIFTAIAFMYFADKKIDIAVIETGLGGRLDSTNVIQPEVCGITSISMDHMHQLGNTLADIAREKAGIFKPQIPVISAPQNPIAKRVMKKVASEVKSPLFFAGDEIEFSYRVESSRTEGCHTRVCLTTPSSKFEHLAVPVLGEHQAINCGLALALLDVLKQKGMKIDDKQALYGLERVYLPGRMEIIKTEPQILVDGAHNAASIKALIRGIGQHIPYDSMVMIFGCAADKDIRGMMEQIATGADKLIFTKSSTSPRAADPHELAEVYAEMTDGRIAQVTNSLKQALEIAYSAVSREDIICITGSFYLVGEAKIMLQNPVILAGQQPVQEPAMAPAMAAN